MDKSEYMYQYINECVYPYCLCLILKENYQALDDNKAYSELVHQFQKCMDAYDAWFIGKSMEDKEINEQIESFLACAKQKTLKRIAIDLYDIFGEKNLNYNEKIEERLMTAEVNDKFFLKIARDCRKKESLE